MVIISYILMFISALLMSTIYFLVFIMGDNHFYEDIYMVSHSAEGAGTLNTTLGSIKPCLWVFFSLIGILILLNIFVLTTVNVKLIFSIILFVISLLAVLKLIKLDQYIINCFSKTDIYEKYYVDTNKVKVTFPKKKRNIIVIYLESTEASLFSKKNGGAFDVSRIPELEEVALKNLNISNTDKLGGAYTLDNTSCTVFSLVTSMSATPLHIRLGYSYGEKHPFMKKVRSFGNVLKENGYNFELFQGSSVKFSATDYFLKENGDPITFDDQTARDTGLVDKNYAVWWGIEDEKTLEFSKDKLLDLASKDKPFAFVLFTVNTHFPNGYVDKNKKPIFDDNLSNSYAYSSKEVSEYLKWLKDQDFYDNTTIFIMGDHTIKRDAYYRKNKGYERTTYNAIINSVVNGNNKNRKFSQFDMYPTMLASMGAKVEGERIGFGVNLFSGEKTMVEILGRKKFDNEMFKNSDYYNKHILDSKE